MKTQREIREELDAVDREMVRLFEKRMNLSCRMAAWKKAQGVPVPDENREREILVSRTEMLTDARFASQVKTLYETILSLSRDMQRDVMQEEEHHA